MAVNPRFCWRDIWSPAAARLPPPARSWRRGGSSHSSAPFALAFSSASSLSSSCTRSQTRARAAEVTPMTPLLLVEPGCRRHAQTTALTTTLGAISNESFESAHPPKKLSSVQAQEKHKEKQQKLYKQNPATCTTRLRGQGGHRDQHGQQDGPVRTHCECI